MLKKLLLLLSVFVLLSTFAAGQAMKSHTKPFIWTELEADYYLPGQHFIYFRNQYRHDTDNRIPGIKETGALKNFSEIYVLLGYDHKFNDNWRGSISGRYTFSNQKYFASENTLSANNNRIWLAMLQHNGKIGTLDFVKRLAYDVTQYDFGDSRGRTRPRAALEKSFKFKEHTLRPHISYELFIHNNFKPDEELEPETRTVDRTRWRIALSFKASPILWITPYFIKQTDYYIVEPSFKDLLDPDGNPVLDASGFPVQVVAQKGGKLNRITPIFGLDIRFMIPGKNLNDTSVPNLGSLNDASGN